MPLSSLLSTVEKAPIGGPKVIEFGGDKLEFREPTTADSQMPPELTERLRVDYPKMPADTRPSVVILARCYRPPAEEITAYKEQTGKEWDSLEVFARLWQKNQFVVADMFEAFCEAFPAWSKWLVEKANAKNALAPTK